MSKETKESGRTIFSPSVVGSKIQQLLGEPNSSSSSLDCFPGHENKGYKRFLVGGIVLRYVWFAIFFHEHYEDHHPELTSPVVSFQRLKESAFRLDIGIFANLVQKPKHL